MLRNCYKCGNEFYDSTGPTCPQCGTNSRPGWLRAWHAIRFEIWYLSARLRNAMRRFLA